MLGNVSEWCGDGKGNSNYPTGEGYTFTDPRMDPERVQIGAGRITRGGAYNHANGYLTVYNRVPVGTADRQNRLGFRVVVTVKPEPTN